MPALPVIAAPVCGLLMEKFRLPTGRAAGGGIQRPRIPDKFNTGMMARRY